MKKSLFLFLIMLACSVINIFFVSEIKAQQSETNKNFSVSVPVSLSYSSVYWWRGGLLNNNAGVFWAGTGAETGGFSLSLAAGLSEEWFTGEDSASEKEAKSFTEADYALSYLYENEIFSVKAGIMLIQYPFYDAFDKDAADCSFLEGNISFVLATILSPALNIYYDYYLESYKDEYGKDAPVAEDYYISFSLSHDIIKTQNGFSFSVSGLAGYYNNAYLDMKGFSDTVITAGIAQEADNILFTGGISYGRTIGRDFKEANDGIKNHFWSSFGVLYTI